MNHDADLAHALERIGLQQYVQVFKDEGFETWKHLLDITEEDMSVRSDTHDVNPTVSNVHRITLNVRLGHRRVRTPIYTSPPISKGVFFFY